VAERSSSELPQDTKGYPIQGALRFDIAQKITVSGTTARNGTDFTRKVIRVYSTEDAFIKLGDDTVEATANDHFLPKEVVDFITVDDSTRLAAIQDSTGGTLYISELA